MYMNTNLQHQQAQMAMISLQQRQARLAFLNSQQGPVKPTTLNKNGKRPRGRMDRKDYYEEFGEWVPKRLKDSHGKFVDKSFAFHESS
jgi:hypothetical protein